jgi:hypothetical protein
MAAKLKDGLFMGDCDTSKDPEFLELNKISNLINLAGNEVPNVWAEHGLAYLTYPWEDNGDCVLFDEEHDNVVKDIVDFVEGSLEYGISVLIFSQRGCCRAAVGVCVYFMYKFGWGFEKSYDFIYSKKPDIELNRGFIQQMFALERRMQMSRFSGLVSSGSLHPHDVMRAKDWNSAYLIKPKEDGSPLDDSEDASEELVLLNSYLNSKNTIVTLPGPYTDVYDAPKEFKLKFNPLKQEEDIHMFPTDPQPRSARPLLGGVMKGMRAKRDPLAAAHARRMGKAVVKGAGMEDLNELSDVSDPASIDMGDGEKDSERVDEYAFQEGWEGKEEKGDDDDDDNNDDEVPISPLVKGKSPLPNHSPPPKTTIDPNERLGIDSRNPQPQHQQYSTPHASPEVSRPGPGNSSSQDRVNPNTSPNRNGNMPISSQDRGRRERGGGDSEHIAGPVSADLYQFVGLEKEGSGSSAGGGHAGG